MYKFNLDTTSDRIRKEEQLHNKNIVSHLASLGIHIELEPIKKHGINKLDKHKHKDKIK